MGCFKVLLVFIVGGVTVDYQLPNKLSPTTYVPSSLNPPAHYYLAHL